MQPTHRSNWTLNGTVTPAATEGGGSVNTLWIAMALPFVVARLPYGRGLFKSNYIIQARKVFDANNGTFVDFATTQKKVVRTFGSQIFRINGYSLAANTSV